MSETDAERIARLESELAKAREDLRSANNERIRDKEMHLRTVEIHHTEKMELMRRIGTRVETILDNHEETMNAILNLDDKLTVAPSINLEHGYAIVVQPIPSQADSYTIRFIAGQRHYVDRQLSSLRGDVWRHFDATGNPIDLRNRFKQAANQMLNDRLSRVSNWNCIIFTY